MYRWWCKSGPRYVPPPPPLQYRFRGHQVCGVHSYFNLRSHNSGAMQSAMTWQSRPGAVDPAPTPLARRQAQGPSLSARRGGEGQSLAPPCDYKWDRFGPEQSEFLSAGGFVFCEEGENLPQQVGVFSSRDSEERALPRGIGATAPSTCRVDLMEEGGQRSWYPE